MDETELAQILRRMYRNAPDREKTTAIHLFGIRYATELGVARGRAHRVVELSRLGDGSSYGTEVRKGMRLAQYVELKDNVNWKVDRGPAPHQVAHQRRTGGVAGGDGGGVVLGMIGVEAEVKICGH